MSEATTPAATPVAPVQVTTTPVSPSPAVSAAPAVDAPAALAPPVVPSLPPEAAPTPVAEAPKADSILGAEPPKVETKPAETKTPEATDPAKTEVKAEEVKTEEGAPPVEVALPTYEAFKLPDGLTMDDAKLGDFTKELGEFQNLTKADQAEVQKFGQKLVDRHVAEVQDTVKRVNEYYQTSFEKMRSEWKDGFEKDPEIGGARRDTTINAALQFIRTHGGNEEQQTELRQLMNTTGVGNHRALIRLLATANSVITEGKPLPAQKPQPTSTSKVTKRYGGTT